MIVISMSLAQHTDQDNNNNNNKKREMTKTLQHCSQFWLLFDSWFNVPVQIYTRKHTKYIYRHQHIHTHRSKKTEYIRTMCWCWWWEATFNHSFQNIFCFVFLFSSYSSFFFVRCVRCGFHSFTHHHCYHRRNSSLTEWVRSKRILWSQKLHTDTLRFIVWDLFIFQFK